MSDNKDSGRIRVYVYSSIMGIVSSFGFFMFTAWLSLTASNKADEHPVFFPISAVTCLICFIVFVVLSVLWIMALVKQKSKSRTIGISVTFAADSLDVISTSVAELKKIIGILSRLTGS